MGFVTLDAVIVNEAETDVAVYVETAHTLTYLQPSEHAKLLVRDGVMLSAFPCRLANEWRTQMQKSDRGDRMSRLVNMPIGVGKDQTRLLKKLQNLKVKALQWQIEFAWGLRQEVYIAEAELNKEKTQKSALFFSKACEELSRMVHNNWMQRKGNH